MSGADDKGGRRRQARQCPICRRPATPEYYPFCSPRCRDRDLYRWLSGAYAIPVVEEDGGGKGDERDQG